MVTGRLNAMAARITDLKVAAAGAASSVEAAKKRLAAAESEGAANAALTRDLEEQKAETDAFLQDAVERLTRLENIKGGLTLKVESRRGSWRRRTRTNRSSCAPSRPPGSASPC